MPKPGIHGRSNDQTGPSGLFRRAKQETAAATTPKNDVLRSTDPDVQAFYDSLTPYERIAHTIAVDKLGTSYTVRRTHGFLKWKSLQK